MIYRTIHFSSRGIIRIEISIILEFSRIYVILLVFWWFSIMHWAFWHNWSMMVRSDVVSILICSVRFMSQLQIAVLVDMIRIRKRCSCVFILEVIRNSVSTASTKYSSTISVALTGFSYDILGCSSIYRAISKEASIPSNEFIFLLIS